MVIQTYSGRMVDVRCPDVVIEDIARALSHQGRFNGHTDRLISVAEHSVAVSMSPHLLPHDRLPALLHDAGEAYVGDVVKPVKDHLHKFAALEDLALQEIFSSLAVPWPDDLSWARIKRADNDALFTEANLFKASPAPYPGTFCPHMAKIYRRRFRWWRTPERLFLARFAELERLRTHFECYRAA